MALSFATMTLAGQVGSEPLTGKEPLPWLMVKIEYHAMVWDRHSNRTAVRASQWCVIRGAKNVETMRKVLSEGREVLVSGPVVPAWAVAGDGERRGNVLVVDVIQFPKEET